MSSLRILNIPQDENAGAEVLRGQIGKPVQALQFSKGDGLLKPAFGPRKALGNITNKASELSGLGKSTVKRRPLGDLTNSLKSANKQGTQQKGTATKPNASTLLPSSSSTAPSLSSQLDAALEPLELQWARDGVEKSAGRSWEQQEQLRQQQEDDEIATKLRMVAGAVPKLSLPFYQVPDHSMQDSDDELQMVPELEHSSITDAFCPSTSLADLDAQLDIMMMGEDSLHSLMPDISVPDASDLEL